MNRVMDHSLRTLCSDSKAFEFDENPCIKDVKAAILEQMRHLASRNYRGRASDRCYTSEPWNEGLSRRGKHGNSQIAQCSVEH